MLLNEYEQAINYFKKEGATISDLDDLLIRGTGNAITNLMPGWSDIDFSIIVKKLTSKNRKEIRNLICYLKQRYSFKISVTVVTQTDFESKYHYHGAKPLYYGEQAKNADSLLKKKSAYIPKFPETQLLISDCYSDLAYLVHDLRKQYFARGSSVADLQKFAQHLVKRTKHIIRNSIVSLTGKVQKPIVLNDVHAFFPKTNKELLQVLTRTKHSWAEISEDTKKLEGIIEFIMEQVDVIHETVVKEVKL